MKVLPKSITRWHPKTKIYNTIKTINPFLFSSVSSFQSVLLAKTLFDYWGIFSRKDYTVVLTVNVNVFSLNFG